MADDITRISSRIVYENRWMRVREDNIRRRDGSQGIYGVIEKIDYAVIVPIEDGFTYLVEQYRYPVGGRYWEFPQGSLEGNANLPAHEVARAELLEETGLLAQELSHLGHLFECYGYSTQGYNIFIARHLRQTEARRELSEQDMICRRFSLQEVATMIMEGQIKDATTVAAFGLLRLHGLA